MEYWIINNDMNIWKVIQNGNSLKRTGRGSDRGLIILPPTTAEEHLAVQMEAKARTTLLQSIPDDRIADFHYMDDKILSQLNQLDAKPDAKEINLRFLRALPSLWFQVALTLKTKGGLEFLSFDDLYYKLKTLEVDVRGYSTFSPSQSVGPSHTAFVSATSTSKIMPYGDSLNSSSPTTYPVPSIFKTGKLEGRLTLIRRNLLGSTSRRSDATSVNKEAILPENAGNDKQRYSSFKNKETGRKEEDSKALVSVNTLVDWSNHDSESDEVIAAKEFGMIAGCDSADAIKAGANKLYNMINGTNSEEANTPSDAREFALMGVTSEKTSSKNLYKLIDSSMSVRTKVGLGFTDCISQKELGWDDFAFSVFTTTSEDVEDRPTFHRFAKTDSMKVVPPPLTGDYTFLSDHTDLDESQMSYGTNSSTSCDPKSVPNDSISCDDSDKSSEDNTNDLASSDFGLKSSEHNPTDTSCASTSSVFTSVNEAEIESTVRKPIKEPISHFRKHASFVSKFYFVCGSGTHLIKDCDFYEKQMANTTVNIRVVPAVRPQPVPTGKPKVKPVPTGKPKVKPVPTGKPKVKSVSTGKPEVTPVPTGTPQVSTSVPTGRPYRSFPIATDRGCSPSVPSSWWSHTATPLPYLFNPISSYFQPYTPYVPTMYYNHMQYGGDRWATAVKPSAGCSWEAYRKGNTFLAVEDEGIFDSGCSRSMTGNKDRLNDFQAIQGGKVTFGGGEGRITRKGTIHTECLVLSKDFKLPYNSMVVLKVPRKHNLYTINLNDLCPRGNLVCLVAHASFDEGKQHKASYKAINAVSSISEPLQLLYMDLFGPTSIRSIDHKFYCLVITDDYSHFCWVFFLEHKDETYPIFKNFINLVENQLNKKVKAIRCDNGTEFKNAHMIELCRSKGIKREYSNPRTPQQNGIAERKNKTLIEAARTMLADSKLPTMFWTEAVRTACYVLNRVSITSPHNKTPYALLTGNIPTVSYFKPFGCHVTILNTSNHLGKFDGKADEGYIVRYSSSNQSAGTHGNKTNFASTQDANSDSDCDEQVIIVPSYPSHNIQGTQPIDTPGDKVDDSPFPFADEIFRKELAKLKDQEQQVTSDAKELRTSAGVKVVLPGCIPVPSGRVPVLGGSVPVPTGSITIPTDKIPVPAGDTTVPIDDVLVHSSNSTDSMYDGEPITRFSCPSDLGNHDPSPGIFSSSSYDDEFDTALNNVESFVKEEMQQFKFQNVWVLVDLPPGKYAIMTKWILKNKRDDRGIVVRNKARLVAQGHRQEEGIDYDEVFTPEWCDEFETLMKGEFQMSAMGELTFFLASRPDKIFAISACSRHQVTPTTSNLEEVKKIFKYLKGQPKLGLWYPKKSPLVLEAYSDSDYAGANKDRKSTTGGCQFLGRQLISWQCKKQTIVATSSIEAEYVAGANCCGQVLVFSSKLFANMRLNFAGNPMPLLPAMLLQAQAGEGAEVAAQDVPHPVPALDQSLPYLTSPSRQQSPNPVALVLEHDHSSTQPKTDAGSFPSMKDTPLGGDFHTSPPRSSHTPPVGQPSGGAEDPITLTALSSVVSTLVQKVHSLEVELHDHKKLFKDVVGKLVKKVKSLEVKLKTKKRKMVVSDFDEEDGTTPNVDLDALHAPTDVPAATTPADSFVASGASSVAAGVAPGASGVAPGDSDVSLGVYTPPTATFIVYADDPTVPTIVPTDSPKIEEDRLGEETARRLHVEEMVEMERERAEAQRKRQQEDRQNRPLTPAQQKAYMRQYVKNQSSAIYNTGWSMAYVKSFSDEQLLQEFEKIRKVQSQSQLQAFSQTLKRPGSVLEKPPTKKPKFPEASTPSMSEISISPAVTSPPSSRTWRKSLGRKHVHKPKSTLPTLDLDAPAQTFLKVIVNEDSDDEDSVNEVWFAVVGWEILFTPLGDINALYRIDGSTKHFSTLRQILHMVDRQDLMKLYGLVVQYYEHHTATDVSYLLLVELIKKMLLHKLEIDSDFVGNDLTTAEQLIQLLLLMPHLFDYELASPEQPATDKDISNPFMAVMICQKSLRYVVPTGRVIVPAGRYIVPTSSVIVATGRRAELMKERSSRNGVDRCDSLVRSIGKVLENFVSAPVCEILEDEGSGIQPFICNITSEFARAPLQND
nr:putative ribonuclease H-like domain-containing protein [Tanacetum cinerariifolium]